MGRFCTSPGRQLTSFLQRIFWIVTGSWHKHPNMDSAFRKSMDIILSPGPNVVLSHIQDPFRGSPHILVLAEAYNAWDGQPAIGNTQLGFLGYTDTDLWGWNEDGFPYWLVVWNMFFSPFSWECHHPSWLIFFRGVGIPPTSQGSVILYHFIAMSIGHIQSLHCS